MLISWVDGQTGLRSRFGASQNDVVLSDQAARAMTYRAYIGRAPPTPSDPLLEAHARCAASQSTPSIGCDSDAPATRLLRRVEHGGPDFAEMAALGISPEGLLDFSVNKEPARHLHAGVAGVMSLVDPSAYPDDRRPGGCAGRWRRLTKSARRRSWSAMARLNWIWLLAQTYLAPTDPGPDRRANVRGSTRRRCVARAASPARSAPAKTTTSVRTRRRFWRRFAGSHPGCCTFAIRTIRPARCWSQDAIEQVLGVLGDGLLVVDEAYLDLAEGVESVLALRGADRRVVAAALRSPRALRPGGAAARLPGGGSGRGRGGWWRPPTLDRELARAGGRTGGTGGRRACGGGPTRGPALQGVAGRWAGAARARLRAVADKLLACQRWQWTASAR